MKKHKDRFLKGYKLIYKPDHFHHTLNQKNYKGYVYEHRYIMECILKRPLNKNEVVHHKDGNKLNNKIENLEVMSRKEHSIHHFGKQKISYCINCGKQLSDYRCKRCTKCYNKSQRKVKRPNKEELNKLIHKYPFTKIGKMFNVSDNTIRKWCKIYNLNYKKKDKNDSKKL